MLLEHGHGIDGIDATMAGGLTRAAINAQPEWLRGVPTRVGDRRLPAGARILFTGCGTSYHAARACGTGVQALDLVIGAAPEADVLVAISHEGETTLTREAVECFAGPTWLITGVAESPIAEIADHVVVATPEVEKSYCHTASYTCAVAAGRALLGEDVTGLPTAVERELAFDGIRASAGERFVVTADGADYATALEAVLKLREGAHVAAEAHQTEQLLHGHLAAIDDTVRCFLLEGRGRAGERMRDATAALDELGCEWTAFPAIHPVVDVVRFQRFAVDLAAHREVDPDMIRWDADPWDRARKAHGF
jgi:glucosamine 6-phosphate synthetase-like amidotransferase/phosphosugar isomerase protein